LTTPIRTAPWRDGAGTQHAMAPAVRGPRRGDRRGRADRCLPPPGAEL